MTDLAKRRDIELDVYQPAEDTRLLARSVTRYINGTDTVLEVGTGSGFIATHIAESTEATVIGSDINPHACQETYAAGIQTVRTDLVRGFHNDTFSVVVFNPPYLPAVAEGSRNDWMERAISGGNTGRQVINRFLDTVGRVICDAGTIFLLVSSLTGLEAIVRRAGKNGFHSVVIERESFPFEVLTVLKLVQ
ncbi:MAG: HemK2/MTQ2 family protein methyltransferase [Halobacteriaceae archaeon]